MHHQIQWWLQLPLTAAVANPRAAAHDCFCQLVCPNVFLCAIMIHSQHCQGTYMMELALELGYYIRAKLEHDCARLMQQLSTGVPTRCEMSTVSPIARGARICCTRIRVSRC